MKKKVIMTVLAVAVMGATLTGCGASASGKSESIEPVVAKQMVQVTEDFDNEVTEAKEDTTVTTETAKDEVADTASEPEATVSVGNTTETTMVKDTEPAKEAASSNQATEQSVANEEDAEVDEEPYFGESGNVDNLKVTLGNSDLYTKEELQSAVGYILGRFQVDFVDCVMTELNYDEAFSLSQSKVWADQYGADEAIVFTCTFNTTENYQELVMEPGQVCEGYNWILTRNEGEDWTLQTWGY